MLPLRRRGLEHPVFLFFVHFPQLSAWLNSQAKALEVEALSEVGSVEQRADKSLEAFELNFEGLALELGCLQSADLALELPYN